MRIYSVQGPDGRIYDIEGPDGASDEAILSTVRQHIASQPPAPNPQSGFMAASKAGLASLKSDIATLAGRTGLMDEAAANKYIKEQEEYRQKTFKPTETWGEAPITKGLELLGGSIPYMAAPVVAGAGALALPEAAIAAPIAAGLTSAAQFTGSNLSRQMAEGKTLGQTELGSAFAASVPQAALDVFSFKLLPGIRGIFAAAGKEVPEKLLLDATKQSVGKITADYTLATGKAAGMEGLTEAGQQVLERLQAGLSINDAKARDEYFDSFIGGAVLGGALAPAGRYVERAGEQSKQQAAQRAESKRLADEARAIQAAEDAKAQELLAAGQRRQAAMERARNMPGFTGITDPNVSFLDAARAQREAEAAALEEARLEKVREVEATQFHADPLENQRRKAAELAKLGVVPEPQEPAPIIPIITPEEIAQQKAAAIQERAAEMPSFTGGPGGINELMMRNIRESQAKQERQQKVDLQAKVDEIRNTDYSSDPIQNVMLQQKEFEKLGFMPYVPIEAQLGMTPEGKEPAAPKAAAAPKGVSKAQLPIKEEPTEPLAPPDVQEAIDYRKQQEAIDAAAAQEKKSKFEGFKRTLTPQEWADIGVEPKPEKVVIDRTANPDNIGINAEPIAAGGKPFATRKEAMEAKNNFKPVGAPKDARPVKLDNYMVVKGKEGYVLSPKVAEDYAREKKAARRLSGITTEGREYMNSLEAIVSNGGLRPEIARETPYMNQNPRIGGKFLFQKNGLTLERAGELLMQDGYPLPENYTVNDVLDLINNPKLTPQGDEAFYEAEMKQQERDRNLAELNEDAYLPTFEEFGYEEVDIESAGLDKVSPKLQAEVRALIAEAESMGIDLDEMIGKIYDEKFTQGPNVYYRAAIDAINEVLASRRGAVSEAADSETKAPARPETEEFALKTETADEVRAKQAEAEKRAAAEEKAFKEEEAKAKADAEVGEFTLTGSNRPADVAAAQGQKDIFAAPEEKKPEPKAGMGAAVMGERMVNAADRFRDSVVEQFGLTSEQADKAMGVLLKEKVLKLDSITGQFNLKDGRFWDRDVMLRAAGEAKPKPKAEKPAPKAEKELPPVLPIPDDYKPIKGRHPQVVMAARELAAGRISKAQYDKYVDAYKEIAKVSKPEPPLTTEGMSKVLNKTQKTKINPEIEAGTKVGLRMDIKALQRGDELGLNGSVVAIHPENNPKSPIGYASAARVTDVRFVIRSEKAAMKVAMGEESKMPQQTVEGTWAPTAPGKVYADVMKNLDNPAWTQVSFDPLRHSFFYDRESKKPVLSADEVLQVGRFVLAKNVKFGEREDFMYMKDVIEAEDKTQTPAFKRWFGDSKVVDANGDPLVVYHGTIARPDTARVKSMGDIKAFDRMFTTQFRAPSIDTVGSWFSTNPGEGGAQMYSGSGPGSAIYPVYLSIQNPQVTTFQLMTRRARLLANGKDDGRMIGEAEVNAYRKWLKAMGKDGIKINESGNEGSTEFDNQVAWIALEPNQIKSATGNIGTYSPTSPDITNMKDMVERNATPAQIKEKDDSVKQFGGDVIYQDGDIGVYRNFNLNYEPIYRAFKKDNRILVNIEDYTGKIFSEKEKTQIKDAIDKWKAEDAARYKNDPFVKFDQDGVAFSQSISPEIAGIFAGWKKMLKLDSNIYLTTVEDTAANRLMFTGEQATIGAGSLHEAGGYAQRLKNGDYVIAFKPKQSKARTLEVLAHELGHIHEKEVFYDASKSTKDAIKVAYSDWLKKTKGMSASEYVQELRARATGKTTVAPDMLIENVSNYQQYWSSFAEWYADQVSKWATTQEKPLTVVEKFFAKLGAAMKAFYAKLRGSKYLPNETFKKYLDRVTDAAIDATADTSMQMPLVSDQMELNFMKETIKAKAQEVLQTRAPMNVKAFEGLDEDVIADVNKNFFAPNLTIIDRMDQNKNRMWEWVAQKTADEFRSAKTYSPMGHMQATLSKDTGGALENLLYHGHVTMREGALDVIADENKKGFIDSVKPLGQELDRWQVWMALSREANLPEEKRSSRLDDLVDKKNDFVKGDINGRPRAEVYEQARRDVMALNKSVLNVALLNGLIDRQAYQRFSNDMFYIPFYRAMEDGQLESIRTASRLSNQQFSKMLRGQSDKPFGDLMENTLRNWSHILSASMKNLAANTILEDAREQAVVEPALKPGLEWRTDPDGKNGRVVHATTGNIVGDGKLVQVRTNAAGEEELVSMTESKPGAKDIVKTQVDGVTTYHHIIDPLLLESIGMITELGPRGLAVDIMRPFKNLLRFGVTASPTFKAYNLIRESIQSAALSDLSGNLVKNVYSGLYDSGKDSPIYRSALAGGAVFNFGSVLEGDRAAAVKKLIDRGVDESTILDTPEKVKSMFTKSWRYYEDLGNKAENANRIALYKQLTERGATHLEASFAARDLMNFSASGSSGAIRFVAATVPFFNARVQGLYKLGRDGVVPTARVFYNTVTGKEIEQTDAQKAKSFISITGAVALASIALYMANKDDEDFKKREQWDRDAFWWAKIPGTDIAIRVPKPFETGAIATLVERTVEQMVDKDVETSRFTDSLSRMVWQTFSMNPVPQFFKPMVDIYANKNPFTNAPIETAGMERLSKQERKTDSTSPIAIALGGVSNAMSTITGESTELSPIQIDYMIRAYMGWLGGTVAASSGYAVQPFNDGVYPDVNKTKMLSLGFIENLPTNQSTYLTDFYHNNQKIQQAYADMRHYAELGQSEKVLEVLQERGSEVSMQKFYDKTSKNLANIRQQIQRISNPAYMAMTGEEKKEEINRLKQLMSAVAEQAESARKAIKKQEAP